MSDTPLAGFTPLNDLISIHTPSNASHNPKYSGPGLIVLCSWLGAATKHIAKYTDTHRRLYPQATILLIQSTMSSMVGDIDLQPAFEVLASLGKSSRVILHAFSNGGARNASSLATGFREQYSRCPFSAIILDSCPGTAGLASTARAISISLPRWHMVRSLGFVAIYILAVIFMLIAKVLQWEDDISRLRRRLNDPLLVPVEVPRLYLYSRKDELVDFRDVNAHAKDARVTGYRVVREEVFERAMHCALVNEDGERYWDAVKEVIESN